MSLFVKRIEDMADVLKLIPYEMELKRKTHDTTPVKDMLSIINNELGKRSFGMWVVYDDEDGVKGYVTAYISGSGTGKKLHVWRMWHDPRRKDIKPVLEEILTLYAKSMKVDVIRIVTTRSAKAMGRIWGFKTVGTVMERRL